MCLRLHLVNEHRFTHPLSQIADHEAVCLNPQPVVKSPITNRFLVQVAPTGMMGVDPANSVLRVGAWLDFNDGLARRELRYLILERKQDSLFQQKMETYI